MTWTYRCLRPKCGDVYTTHRPSSPQCPRCKSTRARWIPQAVSIAKSSPGIDRELRTIATNYGLSDLRSARAGESAVPKRATQNARSSFDWKPQGSGVSPIKVNVAGDGTPLATAGWTGDTVKFTPNEAATAQTNPALGLARNTQVIHRDTRKPQ